MLAQRSDDTCRPIFHIEYRPVSNTLCRCPRGTDSIAGLDGHTRALTGDDARAARPFDARADGRGPLGFGAPRDLRRRRLLAPSAVVHPHVRPASNPSTLLVRQLGRDAGWRAWCNRCAPPRIGLDDADDALRGVGDGRSESIDAACGTGRDAGEDDGDRAAGDERRRRPRDAKAEAPHDSRGVLQRQG